MSDKRRYPAKDATAVAVDLLEALGPVCERAIIAGSLRRKRALVGDVELLFVPSFEDRQVDMFTKEPCDLANERVNTLLQSGVLAKHPSAIGVFTWGPKNKLAIHTASGIPVDFFTTSTPAFWVSLVIRTGGKETNLALTTGAQKRGLSLNAYGVGVTDLRTGKVTPATSERHVFELCGVPYRDPEHRP